VADAMVWMLDHPDEAAAMGSRGHEAVQSKYNWGQQVPVLLALYERIIGARR
jgi:glycosyltransferase involved in cell wall biosynthesis